MIEKKSTKEDGVLATWKITGGKKPSMREFFHLSTVAIITKIICLMIRLKFKKPKQQ
ncbi:MAG: hypothetical protein NWF02_07645 [Candidatus Bathyarchaeota archaeon]|nr:hypothetical protein [Candidatus Bathyarchaeum sp.]